MNAIPSEALVYGFRNDPVGTHGSRTIAVAELRLLFAACPSSSGLEDYRRAVVGDNVLLKKTASARQGAFRALRELYALAPDVLLFRTLRELWDADPQAQPVLALLCAVARDPMLKATAELVLVQDQATFSGIAR